jgi:hypothetical protein
VIDAFIGEDDDGRLWAFCQVVDVRGVRDPARHARKRLHPGDDPELVLAEVRGAVLEFWPEARPS